MTRPCRATAGTAPSPAVARVGRPPCEQRIDGPGAFLEGPEALSAGGAGWSARDDAFRACPDGAVAWLEGGAGWTTLGPHRWSDHLIFADGFESGGITAWTTRRP